MKTYLLDSDILVDFFKRKEAAVLLVEKLGKMGSLAVSVVSVAELRSGWVAKDAAVYLPRLYDLALVIPVSSEVAEQAGAFRERYRRKGITLAMMDMLIGASAVVFSFCLVTRNKKDYPLSDLDLYPTGY